MNEAVASDYPLRSDLAALGDREIVARCQQGDRDAFNILISRYETRVLNLTLRYLRNYHAAVDEAQEIFLKVFRKIKSFKGDSAFGTWLYRVTSNHCLNVLEQSKRGGVRQVSLDALGLSEGEQDQPIQLEDPKSSRPDEEYRRKQLSRMMVTAMEALPPDQRQVIILRHYEGLSYNEMARVLDAPVARVCSCLHRARQRLKRIFMRKGGRLA